MPAVYLPLVSWYIVNSVTCCCAPAVDHLVLFLLPCVWCTVTSIICCSTVGACFFFFFFFCSLKYSVVFWQLLRLAFVTFSPLFVLLIFIPHMKLVHLALFFMQTNPIN